MKLPKQRTTFFVFNLISVSKLELYVQCCESISANTKIQRDYQSCKGVSYYGLRVTHVGSELKQVSVGRNGVELRVNLFPRGVGDVEVDLGLDPLS